MLGSLTSGKPGRNIRRFTMTAPSNLGVWTICCLRCARKRVGYSLTILIMRWLIFIDADQVRVRKGANLKQKVKRPERRGRVGGSNCGALPRKFRQNQRWRGEPTRNPRSCRAIAVLSRAEHCAEPALSLST